MLNPMVAFMSSGVNPDAVSLPLSTLAILSVWQVLTRGIHRGHTLVLLFAAALVKPSAAALFIGLARGVVAISLARRRRQSFVMERDRDREHPWLAVRVVLQAAIVSAWGFYLWSPLLFANQQGSQAIQGIIRVCAPFAVTPCFVPFVPFCS